MGLFDLVKKVFGGASLGPDYYNKLLRLPLDEAILFGTGGRFVQTVGRTGSLGGTHMLVITDRGRLAISDMEGMDPARARHFERGSVSVQDRGYLIEEGGALGGHDHYTLAGPTGAMERVRVLQFTPQQGDAFRVIVVDSVVGRIIEWAEGAAP